jgi:hypothetical protein
MLGAHSAIKVFEELNYFGNRWDPRDNRTDFSEHDLSEIAAFLVARQNLGLWGNQVTSVERSWGRRLVQGLAMEERSPAGVFAACLKCLTDDAGKIWACEQTPGNIFFARRLFELYPNAVVVHVVRDPRAVLASYKDAWRLGQIGGNQLSLTARLRNRVNYHPITISKAWTRFAEESVRLIGHSRFRILRYEELTSNPRVVAERLCNALGLSFEPQMIETPRWGNNAASEGEVRATRDEGQGRTWCDTLTRSEALICEGITQGMLRRFGYSPELLGSCGVSATLPSLLSYPLHLMGVMTLNPRRFWSRLRRI